MNNTNLTIATKDGVSKLIKPKFGPGMLLRAEDLDLLKDYTRDLSRLMFRSLFGCGVVCGLVVEVTTDCGIVVVTVHSGLAIACSGEPIYIPKDVTFPLHDDCDEVAEDEEVWIMLCAKEKCCGPRTSICASDDDDSPIECTREKDWWEIKVVSSPPECVCSCIEPEQPQQTPSQIPKQNPNAMMLVEGQQSAASANNDDCKCATGPCYDDHYAGLCKCHCGDCSDCDCKCVLLARAKRDDATDNWNVDHSVRRFVRPILMRDPQVEIEKTGTLSTSTALSQSVNQAAFIAAHESVRKEAEKAAQQAAQTAAQKIVKEIGKRAANLVVKQVVDDVARQAARDAIAKEVASASEAAAPAEAPPQTVEADEAKPTSKTTKQTTKKSGLPGQ